MAKHFEYNLLWPAPEVRVISEIGEMKEGSGGTRLSCKSSIVIDIKYLGPDGAVGVNRNARGITTSQENVRAARRAVMYMLDIIERRS